MSPYWSYEVCGWVPVAPLEVLDTPWAGHGLPVQHADGPGSRNAVVRSDVALPEQRAAAVPVDA